MRCRRHGVGAVGRAAAWRGDDAKGPHGTRAPMPRGAQRPAQPLTDPPRPRPALCACHNLPSYISPLIPWTIPPPRPLHTLASFGCARLYYGDGFPATAYGPTHPHACPPRVPHHPRLPTGPSRPAPRRFSWLGRPTAPLGPPCHWRSCRPGSSSPCTACRWTCRWAVRQCKTRLLWHSSSVQQARPGVGVPVHGVSWHSLVRIG